MTKKTVIPQLPLEPPLDKFVGAEQLNNFDKLYLPEGAKNFTTMELKANFLGTATEGSIHCAAEVVHQGRTTQIWDALVTSVETGRKIAMFRCT